MSKAITPAQAIKKDIASMKAQFHAALPNHISVDKFVRTIQTAVATSPGLVKADRASLFAASMKAAADGLLPDGKEAAIVTFGNQASYMPMIGGILKKVRNSGELTSITSQIVYENDEFKFWIDEDGEHISHIPNLREERGKEILVYALAKTKDGGVYIEVMSKEEIMAVKNVSRGKNGPWSGAFASEMWRKTAVKRLAKRLPMSTDLEHTINADNELYDLEAEEQTPPPPAPSEEKEVMPKAEEKDETKPSKLSELIVDESEEIPI